MNRLQDLENVLGLLREREQEIQLLRTEMNSLKEQQAGHVQDSMDAGHEWSSFMPGK